MNFNPSVPEPYSDSWREAYKYEKSDEPRLSSYQAPNGTPVPFVLGSDDFSGGQSVDTSEFPCYGYWSNNPLNEQPQEITINGTIRGEKYIANRNALIEALRVTTDDDNCGYLDLPLWGRFPVVVINYKVGETGEKSGSCNISLTFKRAGISEEKRLAANTLKIADISKLAEDLQKEAVDNFVSKVSTALDSDSLVSGFEQFKKGLISAVGRIQGAKAVLNDITNKCNMITSLIAQGVKSPLELANSLVSSFSGIVMGLVEIKNAFETYASIGTMFGSNSSDDSQSPIAELIIKRNPENMLQQFLSASETSLEMETATEEQYNTKKELENFNRVLSFCSCAQIFCEFDTGTYQNQEGLWSLFEKLENSLELENSDLYQAVESVRIAAAETMLAKNADVELTKKINREMPLLALAQTLGCDAEKIRSLNNVYDSFLIKGVVKYV